MPTPEEKKVTSLEGKQVLNEGAVRKGGMNNVADVSKPPFIPVAQLSEPPVIPVAQQSNSQALNTGAVSEGENKKQ